MERKSTVPATRTPVRRGALITIALALSTTLLSGLLSTEAPAQATRAQPIPVKSSGRTSLDLSAANGADLARIEISEGEQAGSRPERNAITDLILRVTAGESTLAAALGAPNGYRLKTRRPLLTIETFIVYGRRITVDPGASCSGWVGDILICRTACEGGQFALERRTNGGAGLTLHVGRLPAGVGEEHDPGWRLMACQDKRRQEISIVPAGATSAAFALTPR